MKKISLNDVVRVEIDKNIANIIVNNAPVNTIDAAVRNGLNLALNAITSEADVKAIVLLCEGKTYFSGADIGEFNGPPKEEEYRDLFLRFENSSVPVITAMHGTVMGGGLELALACHYRIALNTTRFALPEVTLGIIPGAGGTQRMPRCIGIEKTLEMVVNASMINAAEGKSLGFIDEVVESDLDQFAESYALSIVEKKSGVRPTSRNSVVALDNEKIESFKNIARKKYPHQTAALTAIEAIVSSASLPFMDGLKYETELVNKAKTSPECKGLVHLFFAERETVKVPEITEAVAQRSINKVAVIGAGTMGSGIAICFANAGVPVTLIDVNQDGLERGLKNIDQNYQSRVDRGRITPEQKQQSISLITGKLTMDAIEDADLVIEAVFEDLTLKSNIFKQFDALAKNGAILATNTSTLDINKIAAVTKRPAEVIGLHFFSPASVMPLLEVVRTDSTSLEVIRTCMNLAKKIRKTPVLSKVCYGFIGNRMMEGYAREAELMALEGATPRKVDDALQHFGMAMGILAVFDMAGIDVGVNVHKANAEQFPPDPTYYQSSQALFDAGRLGQKNGKGYYKYIPGDRNRYDDEEALAILRERAGSLGVAQRSDHTREEIIERCIYPLLNEAIQILDEGVAIRASDIDVAWCAGYGFPRYRGGPLFYADTLGLKVLYDGILKYQKKFGSMHWRPARLLEQLVNEGKSIREWESQRNR
jgi:3-hydroxyacyl-CoA dehydrogenase